MQQASIASLLHSNRVLACLDGTKFIKSNILTYCAESDFFFNTPSTSRIFSLNSDRKQNENYVNFVSGLLQMDIHLTSIILIITTITYNKNDSSFEEEKDPLNNINGNNKLLWPFLLQLCSLYITIESKITNRK